MNINLWSEVIWIVITSLIGSWLIWQAIKIQSNVDILKISINWFSDRPIVLPTLLFLILPFLSTHLLHDLLNEGQNTSKNIQIGFLDKILDKVLLIFATTTSFFIGNRYLEGFKKNQEEKKIAKILIVSMEGHLEYLYQISKNLSGTILSDSEIENIESRINQIQKDHIYESALKSIGVLKIQYVDLICKYDRDLNSLLDSISKSYEKSTRHINVHSLGDIKSQIKDIVISNKRYIMKLSREILYDIDIFNQYKELVMRDYIEDRRLREIQYIDFKKFINSEFEQEMPIPSLVMMKIESLFKEYGLLQELEDFYQKNRPNDLSS
jgi:hypothetical protein